MSAAIFLNETEHAIAQLFESLSFYHQKLKSIKRPIFISADSNKELMEIQFRKWIKENNESIAAAEEASRQYLGYAVSQSTICGSILQVSCKGISTYSQQDIIPEGLEHISINKKLAKFCIGKLVRGVPAGLVIYAARNQYNRQDESNELSKANASIFNALATNGASRTYKDPAFDLTTLNPPQASSNILSLLGWSSYKEYKHDMSAMLGLSTSQETPDS